MYEAYMYSSVYFSSIAKQAYERIPDKNSGRFPACNDSLVAIIFSAIALESFINELANTASNLSKRTEKEELIIQFSEALNELEESKESTKLKYIFTKLIFSGKSFNKSCNPFQDFELLFKIRNELVHPKPVKLSRAKPKFFRSLESRHLTGIYDKSIPPEAICWIDQISTKNTAKWACNVVANMVNEIKMSIETADINDAKLRQILINSSFRFQVIE